MVERQLKEYVSEKVFFVYGLLENYIGFEVNFKSDVFAFKHFYNSNPSVIPFSFVKSLFT